MTACSSRDYLIATAVKHGGNWDRVYEALRLREPMGEQEMKRLLSSIRSRVVTYFDEDYPEELRRACPKAPLVLFYYGDLSLAQDPTKVLTVVGSRTPSEYAVKKTRELCRGIAKRGYVVASGLARGIDSTAGEATATIPGRSIAVLGCGIDIVYPPENTLLRDRIASTGLLLSEYPNNVPPCPPHFPTRNRILATLGRGTFVGQSAPHSGTMITVAFAMHCNRDVAALPFQAGEETMNNYLIKNGAALIETVDDLSLFLETASKKTPA